MTPTFCWVFLLALVGRAASMPQPLVVDACALICNPGAETESERERDPALYPRYPKVNCRFKSDSQANQAWVVVSNCLKLCNRELSINMEVNCYALRSSLGANLGCYCEALTPLSPNTIRLNEDWKMNFLVKELANDLLNTISASPLDMLIVCEIHRELFNKTKLTSKGKLDSCYPGSNPTSLPTAQGLRSEPPEDTTTKVEDKVKRDIPESQSPIEPLDEVETMVKKEQRKREVKEQKEEKEQGKKFPMAVDEGEDKTPVSVNRDDKIPVSVNRDDEKPVSVNRDDEKPVSVNKDDKIPVSVNRDDEKPVSVNRDDEKPVSVNRDDEKPVSVNKDDKIPVSVNRDDEKPVSVNKDDKIPVSVNRDDEKPVSSVAEEDDIFVTVSTEDDNTPVFVNVEEGTTPAFVNDAPRILEEEMKDECDYCLPKCEAVNYHGLCDCMGIKHRCAKFLKAQVS